MAEEKKFANEVLSDKELDDVAGGTLTQYNELVNAVMKDSDMSRTILATHGAGFSDLAIKDNVEKFLKNKLGIEADISVGLLGTGLFSSDNTYKDLNNGGKSLSHSEVIRESKHIQANEIILIKQKSPSTASRRVSFYSLARYILSSTLFSKWVMIKAEVILPITL